MARISSIMIRINGALVLIAFSLKTSKAAVMEAKHSKFVKDMWQKQKKKFDSLDILQLSNFVYT